MNIQTIVTLTLAEAKGLLANYYAEGYTEEPEYLAYCLMYGKPMSPYLHEWSAEKLFNHFVALNLAEDVARRDDPSWKEPDMIMLELSPGDVRCVWTKATPRREKELTNVQKLVSALREYIELFFEFHRCKEISQDQRTKLVELTLLLVNNLTEEQERQLCEKIDCQNLADLITGSSDTSSLLFNAERILAA